MRFQLSIAALMLVPALAFAQTAAPASDAAAPQANDNAAAPAANGAAPGGASGDGSGADSPASSTAAKSSTPAAQPAAAPPTDFLTFQPTPFESRMFRDPKKITQVTGEDIYNSLCAGCHMPDGKGAVGAGFYPALAGNENLAVGDYPVSIIMNGYHGMPPFRQVLDDAQIVAVVEYLQTKLKDVEVVPPTIETVQAAREAADPLPE